MVFNGKNIMGVLILIFMLHKFIFIILLLTYIVTSTLPRLQYFPVLNYRKTLGTLHTTINELESLHGKKFSFTLPEFWSLQAPAVRRVVSLECLFFQIYPFVEDAGFNCNDDVGASFLQRVLAPRQSHLRPHKTANKKQILNNRST